ncbi:MAG: riboflavin synthase [Clostridiales bacterium]
MFTGIIEEIGEIASIKRNSNSSVLTIKASKTLENTVIGDSISVNGVCLTVTYIKKDRFNADIMPETLNKSSLNHLKSSDKVNLERAMPINGRFGGHIVSGHIDDIGKILSIKKDDNAIWYTIETNSDTLRYIVKKGSIAIDGISLTVAFVNDYLFKVSIIPHTQNTTTLLFKNTGEIVNLECDIIGKYIEKLMKNNSINNVKKESSLSKTILSEHGFL